MQAVVFTVLSKISSSGIRGIEDIVDRLFIRINRLIYTRFSTLIITEIIIIVLVHIGFRCTDFGPPFITVLFRRFLALK